MRILIVSNLYPPLHLGGYELRCAEVAAALHRRGHTVHIMTGQFGLPHQSAADVPQVSRVLHVAHGPPWPPESLPALLRAVAQDHARVATTIDSFRPDVIDLW